MAVAAKRPFKWRPEGMSGTGREEPLHYFSVWLLPRVYSASSTARASSRPTELNPLASFYLGVHMCIYVHMHVLYD